MWYGGGCVGWQRLAVSHALARPSPPPRQSTVLTQEQRRVPPAQTANTSSPSGGHQICSLLMPCATTSPSCTTAGTLCWCARAGGLAKSAWAVRGRLDMTPRVSRQRKSSTSTRTRIWRWRPSLGSSSWLRVPSPSLSSITTCCPTRACWTGKRSAPAFPEHRLLELLRILRSIPDKVVEMMQRRVVFMFEEFFKSLSTQVHTALESARINLFCGDNAWQGEDASGRAGVRHAQ
ncbi:hypothetical protein PTSG_09683 [Salpingoeca rosetta]|uniref:Uncharacterized protein n=1 Tax=Salpingoeca rosetta (strain ATCC 50818 / BSB-021) TaxID=946362 RepID=F2ULP6_SALR5|nr:uncharacterized protein PTSG_09683 [Salpingoeca rosetta]EGD78045.1 hypothetical protein PTSG_09683 [Salpingoeca rosetta]|eukprot:XP_004990107.1 hypothetical protein PTSG_09683 [Salpingoeca rosetta]